MDLLLVGGLSLVVGMAAVVFIRNKSEALPTALLMALVVSHVINFPHFAHSYQILYSGIRRRILDPGTPRNVRLRYLWAGFAAPSLIAGFLVLAYASGDARTLGFGANAMVFFVGWHYVKQGFGVLIVLSVIKRIYFTAWERRFLLANGYAVWICSWLAINQGLGDAEYFGVRYLTFGVSRPVLMVAVAVAGATTASVLAALGHRRLVRKEPISWTGAVGYGCALYFWLFAFIDPIYAVFAPAFHSLQYLSIVWRFQLNKLRALAPSSNRRQASSAEPPASAIPPRFAAFVLVGIVAGWLGFIGIPSLLERALTPDVDRWGSSVFMFMFVIWINIHHYFIDNVIWRKDNEDVRKYLFAPS